GGAVGRGRERRDGLGPGVGRWVFDPGQPGRRRGLEKKVDGEPADHALGRSRGGFGTKIHLATDGNGLPLAAEVSAGQRHESLYAEPVLRAVRIRRRNGRVRTRPGAVAGDKGYSYAPVRRDLRPPN